MRHRDEWEKSFVDYGLPKEDIAKRTGLLALKLSQPKVELESEDQQIIRRLVRARITVDDYELVRDDHRVYVAEEAVRQERSTEHIHTLALTEWQALYEGFMILLQGPTVSD